MLFIHAAKDPVISRSYVEEITHDLGVPLKIIDGYHYCHWSNAEEFADVITSFAAEKPVIKQNFGWGFGGM
jgi:pimeloyl-ACP methyl ester carboxylesterase